MTFTYADARAVAQRLDDVLGIDGWQFEVKVADAARSVVHGSLAVVIEGKTTIRQDFGYPNSAQDDEPLKSAASDALRRCAAQIGVGRSLYSPEKGIQTLPRVATPVSVAQKPKPEALSTPSDDDIIAAQAAILFAQSVDEDRCSHGELWTLKPAGISKASGKRYEAFWAASHKAPDGTYCREKPSAKFLAGRKPSKPVKVVPQDDPSEYPF
jgi:hypothetical protein